MSNFRLARNAPETPKDAMTWQHAIEFLYVAKGVLMHAVPESMLVTSQNGMMAIIAFLKEQQQLQLQQHPQDATLNGITDSDFLKLQETAQLHDDISDTDGHLQIKVNVARAMIRNAIQGDNHLNTIDLEDIDTLLSDMHAVLALLMPTIESIIEHKMSKLEN